MDNSFVCCNIASFAFACSIRLCRGQYFKLEVGKRIAVLTLNIMVSEPFTEHDSVEPRHEPTALPVCSDSVDS